jgi:pilus assembly protein CpaC
MRGRIRKEAVMAVAVVVLVSCGPHSVPLTEEFKDQLAEWSAGRALKEGLERQKGAADMTDRRGTQTLEPGASIWVQSGKSRIVKLDAPVKRVSIANPELAGIVVLNPTTLMINGKELPKERHVTTGGVTQTSSKTVRGTTLTAPPVVGETTLVVWDRNGATDSHTIFVADFIDEQVMLEVTVAEVNRTSLEQHGVDFLSSSTDFSSNFFMGGGRGPVDSTSFTPGTRIVPLDGGGSALLPSDPGILPLTTLEERPTFAFRLPNEDITAFIQILQGEGLATILAQPKILALSGQQAVFQVGGEIPIRIVSSFIAEVEFKPFGTLVNFMPRISEEGDIILTVTPEVSQPDFNSPVEGIPTFRTRRASTSARLRDGETLVIGGLLQTARIEEVRGVPYLQDIPWVGYFFRQTEYQDEVTELMVIVTPHIVSPIPAGETLELPTDRAPLTNEEVRTKPDPAKATRPRLPGMGTGPTLPGMP